MFQPTKISRRQSSIIRAKQHLRKSGWISNTNENCISLSPMAKNEKEMSLKLLVDGASEKVLYAEAKKDFIDFLFGLLQIPIGSIMGLLVENGFEVTGSFGRVMLSVSDMEDSHFHSWQHKDVLVRPKVSSQQDQKPYDPPLLLKEFASWDSTGQTQTQTSEPRCCSNPGEQTHACYQCGHLCVIATPAPTPVKVEGYLKADNNCYMVMDDLVVSPMSTISVFALLKKFKIKDLGLLEEKIVKVDFKKGLELVKASMVSDTALTDVFIRK